jgi:acetolactate synthase I/III small subunit
MDNVFEFPAHSISLLVENKPGVLVRVALVFSRRGYNIDSLVVSPGMDGRFARMNIVARGNPETLEQIIAQLEKLVDVLHAQDHTGHASVERELALIKVACPVEDRGALLQLVSHFKAVTVDMTNASMIIQVTGSSEKIDAIRQACEPYAIREFIRTGKVIMLRGLQET